MPSLVIDAETLGEIFARLEDRHTSLKIDLVDLRPTGIVGTEFEAGLLIFSKNNLINIGVLIQRKITRTSALEHFSSPVVGTGETPLFRLKDHLDALLT